jgi:hypothetical protein
MPLTPTHMLAIVPIAAAFDETLPFSALAIGSMIPDLPLFVPLVPGYQVTHSFAGVFTACLPLGVLVFVGFQYMLKRPLLALMPVGFQRRCASVARPRPGPRPSPRALVGILVAIVLGALTHVVWDAFTHHGRWGTELVPWLGATALTLASQPVPGYKVAQYGCSLVGLPLLAWLAIAWLRRQEPGSVGDLPEIPRAGKVAVGLSAVAIPALVTLTAWCRTDLTAYERLGESITGSGLYLIVATLAYGLVFQLVAGRSHGGSESA